MNLKEFKYEGKTYTCTEQDILRKCGSAAEKLVRCKKGRYGFEVVYKMKSGQYDDRDSSLISSSVSYFLLIKKDKLN